MNHRDVTLLLIGTLPFCGCVEERNSERGRGLSIASGGELPLDPKDPHTDMAVPSPVDDSMMGVGTTLPPMPHQENDATPMTQAETGAQSRGDAGTPVEYDAGVDATADAGVDDPWIDASVSRVDSGDSSADAFDGGDAAHTSFDFVVGTRRILISARRGRTLPVQLWYPAVEEARSEALAGHPIVDFEPVGPRRALLERLLSFAPEGCTNRHMRAALDAPVNATAGPFALLVYSHHLEGMRLAQFSVAEALARRGFVVAAPDHEGMSLYDRTGDLQTPDLIGTLLRFNPDSLAIRADDMESVLDVLLDPAEESVPEGIRGRIDETRIGAFGHSLGSMTIGVVAARDPRVRAAAYLAMPPAVLLEPLNLLGQPAIEAFRTPALFMLNLEDAPLTAVAGIDVIRAQFDAHPEPAFLVEVRDTGHWSFADDCAIIPDFADGCGSVPRPSNPRVTFDNLENVLAREIAAEYLGAFFGSELLGHDRGVLVGEPFSPNETVREHP